MKAVVVALLAMIGWKVYDSQTPASPVQWVDDCSTISNMLVDGTYQNKNLYIQNPLVFCSDSVSRFCVVSVTINDSITMPEDSFGSSAFEIPLTSYGFQAGDPVHIVISHHTSGKPKVLNPEVY